MSSSDSAMPVIPVATEDPGLVERARRFSSVVALAARIYSGYKTTQLWTRYVSDANKAELYRRQDLRSARALYHTAISLEGIADQGLAVHRDPRRFAARRMGLDAGWTS